MRRAAIALFAAIAAASACGQESVDGTARGDSAGAPRADTGTTAAPAAAVRGEWPDSGPIAYRRERATNLRGSATGEAIIATAHGPSYDSLEIALTILGERGDTLWHEAWPSLLYFKYDTPEGKADTTIARIVRDHVDQLLANDRFNMAGGLPAVLRRGGDPDALMREAIQYHLAELDWRRTADLPPAAPTPPEAYAVINTEQVARERVDAVLAELRARPSFMYFAGGEATYAIAWSDREHAFIRIYSCC